SCARLVALLVSPPPLPISLVCVYRNLHCHFFFTVAAPSATSPLSLHDALPIYAVARHDCARGHPARLVRQGVRLRHHRLQHRRRSEEHTSELQSHLNLVCRLLLEKKKNGLSLACCHEGNVMVTDVYGRRTGNCL